MPSLSAYLLVGGTAAVVTFALIPLVIRLSPLLGAVVEPDEHHIHERPTPTAGGVAMMVGVVVATAVAFGLPHVQPLLDDPPEQVLLVLRLL